MKKLSLFLLIFWPSISLFGQEYNDVTLGNMKPIEFNQRGIQDFLTRFSSASYREQTLPKYFMHIIEFMDYSKQMDNPRSFCLSICNLFHVRFKDCTWTHPYAFTLFLNEMPKVLSHVCGDDEVSIKTDIKNTIREALLNDFQGLKTDPNGFLDRLSATIYNSIMHNDEPTLAEFQSFMTRFLENVMCKLVWDPMEGVDTWESTKMIAEKLDQLGEVGIIGSDQELNNLYWSLITRYCYFLDSFGTQISQETLCAIQRDIHERTHILVALAEDEELVITKAERLQQSLLTGFALYAQDRVPQLP